MTISNERLAEMVGAGVPCVPASPGEIVAIVQELRSLRQSPAGVEPAAWAEVMSGKVYTIRLDRSRHCTEPLYHASALAALQSRVTELEAALRRQKANIEHWLATGEAAGQEESKSIYDQICAALQEADHG